MCGLSGFLNYGDENDLNRMMEEIRHRGPDAFSKYVDRDQGLFLGHTRLSIIDIEGGKQPMPSTNGRFLIVFNGEVYNHLDIRKELEEKGYRFKTSHSDTETILVGFEEYGQNLWIKLNGMFACAIYDKEKKQLTLARDRFGQKPLYYYQNDHFFAFSSELKSLMSHQHLPEEIDQLSMARFLINDYIPAPLTIYRSVFKLEPGNYLTYQQGKFQKRKYWHFSLSDGSPPSLEEFQDKMKQAVNSCLISDVPLGVFLSGGLDSSTVATIAAQKISHLKTYSIGFDDPSYDESRYARKMAEAINSDHKDKIFTLEEAKSEIFPILKNLGEPLGDSSLLPTYLVSHLASQDLKVVLGGDGMDELMAGYGPFKAVSTAKKMNSTLPVFWKGMASFALKVLPTSFDYMSLDFKIQRFEKAIGKPLWLWPSSWMSSLSLERLNRLLETSFTEEEIFEPALSLFEKHRPKDEIDWLLTYYSNHYLPNNIFHKVDTAAMMNSLEVRAPFLDNDFVDMILKMPNHLKLKNDETKYYFKKAISDILPHDILNRKKQGFGVPVASWLADSHAFKFKGDTPFSSSEKESLIHEHRAKEQNHKSLLWNLYVIENSYVGRRWT